MVNTQQADEVPNSVVLESRDANIVREDVELRLHESEGGDSNFWRLLCLCYAQNGNVHQNVHLLGIDAYGKYGITLGVGEVSNPEEQCNIQMVFIGGSDQDPIAGFFDHHLSQLQPDHEDFKLKLGVTDTYIYGTDFSEAPDSSTREQEYACKHDGWERYAFDRAKVDTVFAQGVPMLVNRGGNTVLTVGRNTPESNRVTMKEPNMDLYAFDNCGNRILLNIDYTAGDWGKGPWGGADNPIQITNAASAGGTDEPAIQNSIQ